MTPAARIAAAIDVLADVETRRRPAADALKDWGLARRFAGSGDRAAIASLVYDALRRKSSSAWIMGEASPRAEMIGALKQLRALSEDEIATLFSGEGHAPASLTESERARLRDGGLTGAPDHIRGDYPEWLGAAMAESCGGAAVEEGRPLWRTARRSTSGSTRCAGRARRRWLGSPISMRKRRRCRRSACASPFAPTGAGRRCRASLPMSKAWSKCRTRARSSPRCSGAKPGMQVLDLCAGAGGKTLALAAMLENQGQVYATDTDGRRLAPLFARLERSGARNVQARAPKGPRDVLSDLAGRCDLVFVDAPCTGSGAWRRNPDAKWRVRPGALETRIKDQMEALENAIRFIKPGGHLVYATCSLLKAENEDRIAAFLAAHSDFLPLEAARWANVCKLPALGEFASKLGAGLRLSPLRSGTDGFYVAALTRTA